MDAAKPPRAEPFELFLLGGAAERGYRRMRPEVERMPWGTLDLSSYPANVVEAARRTWTLAAFQEHRTGYACAATLQALIASRAPLDLIAVATRFPLDELVHVELCARLASELGGPVALMHDPDAMVQEPSRQLPVRLRCAELVVRNFCVGEAVSIPLLRASWKAASHPLIRAVLGRIVKDEAAHGRFGWLYLDWIGPDLSEEERAHLRAAAGNEIEKLERNWERTLPAYGVDGDAPTLGWMRPATYRVEAARALEQAVRRPLARRGLA